VNRSPAAGYSREGAEGERNGPHRFAGRPAWRLVLPVGRLLRMCCGHSGRGGAPAVDRFPVDVAPPDHPDEGNGATFVKKALTWLAVAFVVFYVIQRPEDAAGIVRSAGAALGDAASSLSAFVGSLV
jgi:hypothetical protein